MAFKYWMDASRYLPSAEYFSPLSRYFCLRTLGSREQPVNVAARTEQTSSKRTETERLIDCILQRQTGETHESVPAAQGLIILQSNGRKQLLESYVDRSSSAENLLNAEYSCRVMA